MNRSQRRLQQLKQTVSMKLDILEKQKDDIKEVLDDYSAQIVGKVQCLLGNELDLLQDPERCHEIIRSLDKASQVFTDIAINLDLLLDAADSGTVTTTENQPFMSNKCVASADNEDSETISSISKPSKCETERSVQKTNNTTSSQLFQDGKKGQQHQTITPQQAQFTELHKHPQKENEERIEKQNQEQQEQLKDPATLSDCQSLLPVDVAAQEVTKATGLQSFQCSFDCEKAETAHSSCDSSLTNSLTVSASSLLPSEIINSVVSGDLISPPHSDTVASRNMSSSMNAVQQFHQSCNIPDQMEDHTCKSNSAVSEHKVPIGPIVSPSVSLHDSLSISVFPEHSMPVHGILREPVFQTSSSLLIGNPCGTMVPLFVNVGLPAVTCISPHIRSPLCIQIPESPVSSYNFCNAVSTDQSNTHEQIYSNSRAAIQRTVDNSFSLRDPVSPLSTTTVHISDLPSSSSVSQDQQLNKMPMPCYPTLTPVISETTLTVSESSGPNHEILSEASAVCNESISTSVKPPNLFNRCVSRSDKEHMEFNKLKQPNLEQAQDTVTVSTLLKKSFTSAVTKKTLRGSMETKNRQEHSQNNKDSTSSHLDTTSSQMPKNLIRSLHIKRNVNVKRSSASRNLTELMKEAERAAHEKSSRLNKDIQIEKTSKDQVVKTDPITLDEASISPSKPKKPGLKLPYNKLHTAPSSGNGDIQENLQRTDQVVKTDPITLDEASISPSKPKKPGLKLPYNKLHTAPSSGNGDIQENLPRRTDSEVAELAISSLQPEKDSVFSAVVSTSAHPWSFHVQLVELIPVITGLIKHTVKTGGTTHITPHVGLFCLAESCDQNYYRARVLSVEESPDGLTKSVKVVLIDYGIRKVVSLEAICSMPDSLMQYPCQAIFCALNKAGPKNLNCLWTEQAILEFQQCIKDQQVQVRVVYPSPREAGLSFPHIVDVMFTVPQTTPKGAIAIKSIAEYLIEGGFAKDVQVEDCIEALWQMHTADKHNTSSRMKGLEVSLSNEKMQPVSTTKSDRQKPKVVHQPLCFRKRRAKKVNHLSEPSSATNNSSSPPSSCCGSVSDVVEVSQSRISPQATDKYKLSILVDEKLHSWCGGITSSHTDKKKITEKHVGGDDQGLCNPRGNSGLVVSQDCTEVEILIMMSQIISPSSFFVHLVDLDFIQKLQTLEEELLKLSTSLTKQPAWFNPVKNALVCVIDSAETNCYRGLVLDIHSEQVKPGQGHLTDGESSGDNYLIFFIDYGDFEWTPRSRLFPLPSNLQNQKASVVWCSLEGVHPLESVTTSTGDGTGPKLWSPDVVNAFKSMVWEKKVFSATLSKESFQQISNSTSFQREPVPVFLLDRSGDEEEICLNYELICLNMASLKPLSSSDFDHSGIISEWDPMAEDFTSIRNSYKVDTDEAGVALVGYTAGVVPKGGQKVCVHFNRPKGCLRGDRCPNRHIKVDLSGVPYDQVPVHVFDEDQSDLLPQPGSLVTVTVSVVFSPSLFYVTLPWGQLTVEQLSDPQVASHHTQHETLEGMMASMQEFYSTYPGYDGDLTLLAPGEAMAAKVEGQWVRAKVIFTDVEGDLVQVVLVDYGQVSWVSLRDLRELALQFLHLTPQAVECSLVDVEPPDESGGWNEETCKRFAQMVEGKTLQAQVKHRYPSGKISVVLFETSESTTPSVNQQLENLGLTRCSVAPQTAETASKTCQPTDGGHTFSFGPG